MFCGEVRKYHEGYNITYALTDTPSNYTPGNFLASGYALMVFVCVENLQSRRSC